MKDITKNSISILIPAYNNVCVRLVECLHRQAEAIINCSAISTLHYEIIVAEDGSDDQESIRANGHIDSMSNCRHLIYKENRGRAVIRNTLAQQSQYDWLLFIDSDMIVDNDDFLSKYLCSTSETVVDGGVKINGDARHLEFNLRYQYEKAAESAHTANKRKATPYSHFHTANFIVARDIMLAHPFDERFKRYGYEDILFGKSLKENGIKIDHIDNTLSFEIFEDNKHFIEKTEEGLMTLHQFSNELYGYSNLLDFIVKIKRLRMQWLILLMYKLAKKRIKQRLTENKPNMLLFKLYKIGYYLSIY